MIHDSALSTSSETSTASHRITRSQTKREAEKHELENYYDSDNSDHEGNLHSCMTRQAYDELHNNTSTASHRITYSQTKREAEKHELDNYYDSDSSDHEGNLHSCMTRQAYDELHNNTSTVSRRITHSHTKREAEKHELDNYCDSDNSDHEGNLYSCMTRQAYDELHNNIYSGIQQTYKSAGSISKVPIYKNSVVTSKYNKLCKNELYVKERDIVQLVKEIPGKLFVWLKTNCIIQLLVAFVVMAAAGYYFIYLNDSPSKGTVGEFLHQKITKLSIQYEQLSAYSQSTLTYCLENTLNGNQPCIILILNGGEENFSNLLNEIGDLSVELLKQFSDDTGITKNVIKGSTISKSKEKHSFKYHKSVLEKGKVLLIDEVEMMPVGIMQAFQSLCDVYDPAVAKGVIAFLLNHKHISVDLDQNDATIANNILTQLWEDSMHHDLINPLAIRISENVINLNKKNSM